MYKLVAIDLDGTLLNSYGEISEKNKEAIQKAKNKGGFCIWHGKRGCQKGREISHETHENRRKLYCYPS